MKNSTDEVIGLAIYIEMVFKFLLSQPGQVFKMFRPLAARDGDPPLGMEPLELPPCVGRYLEIGKVRISSS